MQLGLAIPLQRHLKIKSLPYGTPLDRRFCWDLHVITLRRLRELNDAELAVGGAQNLYAFWNDKLAKHLCAETN